jgi:hypothetical protein
MANIDPDRERQQVSSRYAEMSDEELQKLADDSASLSEVGYRCLVNEAQRRGLELRFGDLAAAADELEQRELVTLRQFRDLPEAVLAKGRLASAGIESYLGDDNMVRMNWFISNLLGGIKLKVKPEDVAAAEEVLSQPIPEDFEVDGVGEFEQPRCPDCQSLDITFEALNKPIAYGSAWVGLPLPIPRNSWKCESCGSRWQDTEEPER